MPKVCQSIQTCSHCFLRSMASIAIYTSLKCLPQARNLGSNYHNLLNLFPKYTLWKTTFFPPLSSLYHFLYHYSIAFKVVKHSGLEYRFNSQNAYVWNLAPPCCLICLPQFPHLCKGVLILVISVLFYWINELL